MAGFGSTPVLTGVAGVRGIRLGLDLFQPVFGNVLLSRSFEDVFEFGLNLAIEIVETPDGFERLFSDLANDP